MTRELRQLAGGPATISLDSAPVIAERLVLLKRRQAPQYQFRRTAWWAGGLA